MTFAVNLDLQGEMATIRPARPADSQVKRTIDVVVALLLLLLVLPLLLLVALAVRLESRGPVLFAQRRTGYLGNEIRVLKFRSMSVMEDGHQIVQATRGDARVTRVGGLLRRTSIDELPQLVNVLKGDMSLVGPRPHALAHDQMFAEVAPNYALRFRARPGITGLAQVQGYRGLVRDDGHLRQRIDADNEYIDSWNVGLDLAILLRTAVVVPFQRSAY